MKTLVYFMLLALIGCNNTNNQKAQGNLLSTQSHCKESIQIDSLQYNLLRIDFQVFDTLKIQSSFNEPSSFKIVKEYPDNGGFTCDFKTKNSEITFFSRGFNDAFFINHAKITDNSIKMDYDISIGMTKENFLSNIKQPIAISKCDSIEITATGCTSLFVFDNNRLKVIELFSTI